MKILIDARPLSNKFSHRGVGNYTRSLLKELLMHKEHHWQIMSLGSKEDFLDSLTQGELMPLEFDYISLGKPSLLEKLSAATYSKLYYLPKIYGAKPDVFLTLQADLSFPKGIPSLAAVHDIIPFRLNKYSQRNRIINYINKRNYTWGLEQLYKASRITTISEYSKQDLVNFGIPTDKIVVVPIALNTSFAKNLESIHDDDQNKRRVLNIYNLTENYILYYGGLEPNKNVGQVLHSFSKIANQYPDLKLAIGGSDFKLGWDHKATPLNERAQEIERLAQELKIRHKVIFTGFIEDKHLPSVLKYAKCFVHLSLYEGFGLSVLEAQAASTPVVAADRSSYPEVLGDSAVLIDPDDIEAVAQAISRFMGEDETSAKLRKEYILRGLKNCQRFDWSKTAMQILENISELNKVTQLPITNEIAKPKKTSRTSQKVKPKAVVLACYFHPLRGGVETVAMDYAGFLVRMGYEVTVISSDRKNGQILEKSEILQVEGGAINIIRLRRYGRNHFLYILRGLYSTLREIKPDLIHAHGFGHLYHDLCLLMYKLTSRKINTRFISTPHGPFMSKPEKGLRLIVKVVLNFVQSLYLNRIFDRIVAVNPQQHKWLKSIYRIPQDKVRLSPPVMPVATETLLQLQKHKQKKGYIQICSLGRLTYYKGFQDLITSFNDMNSASSTKLVIAGASDNYETELRSIAVNSPRHEDILIESNVSSQRKDEILRDTDIFVFASEWEAFGIVTAEAMATACAILASDTEGSRFLVQEGENGFLFPYKDYNRLTHRLNDMVSDPKELAKLQANSYKLSGVYNLDTLFSGYKNIISELK